MFIATTTKKSCEFVKRYGGMLPWSFFKKENTIRYIKLSVGSCESVRGYGDMLP